MSASITSIKPSARRTTSEIARLYGLHGNAELFASGTVEHVILTRCLDGAPGEKVDQVLAMRISVRDVRTQELYTIIIPLSRLNLGDVHVGQSVNMYLTKRGWDNHILTWHVLPANVEGDLA